MKHQYKKTVASALALLVACGGSLQAQKNPADSVKKNGATTSAFTENVNIAYGIQPARHVTASISTIKGTHLEKNFNLNAGNTLFGTLPGLTVTQGGSEPGVNAPNLFIRGVNTLGGASNTPLYIIEGYLSNGTGAANAFMQLVPKEIESISILKDAASAALYGARGANGVVLVTTKNGKEGPLKVSFSTRLGFSQPQRVQQFLNSENYAILYNEALLNDGLAPRYTAADIEAYQTGKDPYFHPNVNWYDEVLRKAAAVSSYNLSFSGGDKNIRYYAVLNSITSQGLFKKFGDINEDSSNSRYEKYNFRSNIDITLSKNLVAEFKVAGSIESSINANAYTTSGTFSLLQSLPPNAFPVYNPVGNYGGPVQKNTNIFVP